MSYTVLTVYKENKKQNISKINLKERTLESVFNVARKIISDDFGFKIFTDNINFIENKATINECLENDYYLKTRINLDWFKYIVLYKKDRPLMSIMIEAHPFKGSLTFDSLNPKLLSAYEIILEQKK